MKAKSTVVLYLLLFMTLLAFLEIAASAQAETAPAEGSKPKTTTITWKENDPNCDLIAVEGARYRIIKHNGLFIAFEFIEADGLYVGAVMVSNGSDTRVLVDPMSSFLAVWKDVKKDPHEIITPTDPLKIAKKIESRARWANALRSFGAGMATTTRNTSTTESGNASVIGTGGSAQGTYTGSSSSTTTSPDLEARRRAERENSATSAQAEGRVAGVMSAAFRANTLFPKDRVFGEIYFQKKKFEAGFFVFKIGDVFYQFNIAPAQK